MDIHEDTKARPVLKVGGSVCECTICGLFFTGPTAFDKHFKNVAYQCRTPEQMRAVGMIENPHGVWERGISAEKLAKQGAA